MTTFWICLAALAAGAVNAIAGGGTLLTFPALIGAAGLSERAANVTSTVALCPGSFAGMWGYRKELAECGRWVPLLTAPSVAGGIIGSLLLVLLDAAYFAAIVPWLVLLAAVLFLLQPRLVAWMQRHRPAGPPTKRALGVILVAQFLIGVYGGYFGAGIGILMLSSLGFLGLANIHQMNALKSHLAFCMNAVSVAIFVVHGEIHWPYGLAMAAAAILGGFFGAKLALRMKPSWVRAVVIVVGFGLSAYFFWKRLGITAAAALSAS